MAILLYAANAYATVDSVTSNSPVSGYNTTNTAPAFNFTVKGNYSTYNCALYVNSTSVAQNGTVSTNTPTILTSSPLANGAYLWYINCTDAVGTVNLSGSRVIVIDTIPPTITFDASTSTPNGV